MKNKILLLVIIVLITIANVKSQTTNPITYGYDADGNRTSSADPLKSLIITDSIIVSAQQEMYQDTTGNLTNKDQNKILYQDSVGKYIVNIFPNPTKGILFIDISGNIGDAPMYSLELFDISSRCLQNIQNTGFSGELDLTSYNNGIYLMQITINNQKSQWKIVKQ